MSVEMNMQALLKELKTSDFVLNCQLPMNYIPGFPVLTVRNDRLCVMVPFLRYKITGKVDKTLVYPIRYLLTLSLPEKRVVGFEDLSVNPVFRKVDFEKPVGYFRHEAVKNMNKTEYNKNRTRLFAMYDKIVDTVLYDSDYTREDDEQFRELLRIMLEPSLLTIYKFIDRDFYNKYLAG